MQVASACSRAGRCLKSADRVCTYKKGRTCLRCLLEGLGLSKTWTLSQKHRTAPKPSLLIEDFPLSCICC